MRVRKLSLFVFTAAALLAALVSSASARSLSSTSQPLRVAFREIRFETSAGNTICAVTLEGSFHARTIAKTPGLLAGHVTRVILGACSQGSATLLAESLPWHIQYASFAGTLPNITSLRANLINAAFRIREAFGITCLARSSAAEPLTMVANREASGALTTAAAGGRVRTGAECFNAAGSFLSDNGPITVAGAATRLTITLI
jgi:hypothetical protein